MAAATIQRRPAQGQPERGEKPWRKIRTKDPDNPPLTKAEVARMRPVSETHPEIVEAYRRGRGAKKALDARLRGRDEPV